MKRLLFFLLALLVTTKISAGGGPIEGGEPLFPDGQLFLSTVGAGYTNVQHTICSSGPLWDYNFDNDLLKVVTEMTVYTASIFSYGDYNISGWNGFDFAFEDDVVYEGYAKWYGGIYKVTNSLHPDIYFYFDIRDSKYLGAYGTFPQTGDNFVVFDANNNNYRWAKKTSEINNPDKYVVIESGDLIRVWELQDQEHETDGFEIYWQNSLAPIEQENHPRIVWGKFSDPTLSPQPAVSEYQIWRKVGGLSWQNLATVSANTLDYTDETKTLANQIAGHTVLYKVKAIFESGASGYSNIVSFEVPGNDPAKRNAAELSKDLVLELAQNYPNPFNPTTSIHYTIPVQSRVTLKVYDVLGNEIADLVNENKEAGNYSAVFDAHNLSSGVYYYVLETQNNISTKKMLLVK